MKGVEVLLSLYLENYITCLDIDTWSGMHSAYWIGGQIISDNVADT